MRYPWLIIGLLFTLSACSNATFKGVKGGSSKNDSTPSGNTDDATPGTAPIEPGTPPGGNPNTPVTEDPNTQNPIDPGKNPCEMMTLLSLSSLYQLHDPQCHNPGDDDTDDDDDLDNDDDVDDEDDDDDDPGQNNPGQNDPGQY